MNTFAPGKQGSPIVITLLSKVIFRALDIGNINPLDIEPGKQRHGCIFPVAAIELRAIFNHQSLEFATGQEIAILIWNKAIEQAIATVFRLIDDAGFWVDSGGFMKKSPHGFYGNSLHCGCGIGRHFKNITVVFANFSIRQIYGFFTG